MSDSIVPLPPLDPQIAQFVTRMRADASKFPPRESLTIMKAREVAETVRKPWTQGGPTMQETLDRMVPTRHGDVMIRIYYPDDQRPTPAFVYLHGGGWTLFSIDTHDRLMREYAAQTSFIVIGINYTRAPEGKFPQPVEETIDVLHWLQQEGAALGLDVSRIIIGGDSAGANISMASAMSLRDAGEPLLRGMVLNYGSFDIGSMFTESVVRYGGGDYLLTTHMMVWFRWQYLRSEEDAFHPLASPLRGRLDGLPQAFMVITELDVLHDESLRMEKSLRAAGVPVEAHVYPGTVHSFLEAMSIADISRKAIADTSEWLTRTLSA